ncbi:ATP-binding protein [Metaclostridioides mangenotii]|uniref:ATP-binding protein n=1 Tax=Metaclostridioides mangenotii TaxID=1540 RepID=UPI000481BFB7|nr:sensor histidine kinase [Clostridioides mangenotii]
MIENVILWKFINVGIALLEIWIFCYIVNKVSELKRGKVCRSLIIILFTIFIVVIRFLEIQQDIRLILSLISCIAYYKYLYKISIIKCIVNTFLYFLFLMITEMIGINIVFLLNSVENTKTLYIPGLVRFETIIASKPFLILLAIFITPLNNFFDKIITNKLKKLLKGENMYVLIPILTNIFSLLIIFASLGYNNKKAIDSIVLSFIVFLLFVSNISLLLITSKIIKNNKVVMENELVNNKKVRKLHHDMKNHLMCIGSLCDNKESIDYINDLNKELVSLDRTFNTGNRVLDIILSEKKITCLEKGIKLITEIDFSRSDFMDMLDISTIFANSLDNAIQACDKIKDEMIPKRIDARVKYVNNFCVIKIINSKVNDIIKKKDKILTDKKDGIMHGLGISNIKDAVQKYDGDVVIDYTENEFIFTAMIPIK